MFGEKYEPQKQAELMRQVKETLLYCELNEKTASEIYEWAKTAMRLRAFEKVCLEQSQSVLCVLRRLEALSRGCSMHAQWYQSIINTIQEQRSSILVMKNKHRIKTNNLLQSQANQLAKRKNDQLTIEKSPKRVRQNGQKEQHKISQQQRQVSQSKLPPCSDQTYAPTKACSQLQWLLSLCLPFISQQNTDIKVPLVDHPDQME